MNLNGKTVLVFLEEDNTQRAYFRIRPLLTQEGSVDKTAVEQFPDEGFLRIVPDKNEQHTFKERMRTLAPICLLNLAEMNPEVQKIRTNKNYSPAKGEKNQFIVYSDAVKPLENQYYQVVSENQLSSSLTPLVYTRSGANIQGPFYRENGTAAGDLVKLPPDSPNIFNVTLPDGKELLFYCAVSGNEAPQEHPESADVKAPAQEAEEVPVPAQSEKAFPAGVSNEPPAPAPAPAAPVSIWKQQVDALISGKPVPAAPNPAEAPTAPEPAPAAPPAARKAPQERAGVHADAAQKKNLKPDSAPGTALDKIQALNGSLKIRSSSFREERSALPLQPDMDTRPIGGTKLYKPALERKNATRTRNDLTEAVDQLRNISRYESRAEAPGAVINDPARMGSVPNPVEQFRFILKRVWSLPDTHRQVADTILATSGMRQSLSRILTEGKSNLTIRAMQSQLQDLEAERLMTLMQLDDAKGSLQKLKEEVRKELVSQKESGIALLERQAQEKEALVSRLEARQDALCASREEALEAARSFPWQHTLSAPAALENSADRKALAARLSDALTRAGFTADEDTALILLTLLALCPGTLGICSASHADSLHAFNTIADALGASKARVHARLEFEHPLRIEEGGDGFLFSYDTAPLLMDYPGLIHVIGGEEDDVYLNNITDQSQDRYTQNPWPVFWIDADPERFSEALPPQSAVSVSLIRERMLVSDGELDEATRQLMSLLRATLSNAGAPLPLNVATRMKRFILSLKDSLSTGIAGAIDWAFMCFIVPHIRYNGIDPQVLLPYVGAMPHTFRELEK